MPICLYSGRNAVVMIRMVVVPSPSSVTTAEVKAVTRMIFSGSPLALQISTTTLWRRMKKYLDEDPGCFDGARYLRG